MAISLLITISRPKPLVLIFKSFNKLVLIIFDPEFIIESLNFKSIDPVGNLNYLSSLFTLFCIFALYNALNFIDGYNGSATSVILFWSIFLFIKNPNEVYLIIVLISVLIFLYNLSGKIFLGNSGTSLISIFFALSVSWECLELALPYEFAQETWDNKISDVVVNCLGFYLGVSLRQHQSTDD